MKINSKMSSLVLNYIYTRSSAQFFPNEEINSIRARRLKNKF